MPAASSAGIGDTRRRALMKHFKSIEAVQAASEEELAQVPGMNRAAAENVYRFFRKKKDDIPIEVVEETGNM